MPRYEITSYYANGTLSKQNLQLQSHKQGYQLSSPIGQSAFEQLHPRNRVSTANINSGHNQRRSSYEDTKLEIDDSPQLYLSPSFHGVLIACRLIRSTKAKEVNGINSVTLSQCRDVPK